MEKHARKQPNEDGFASLVIAIALILILSLITVGFAQLMNREERSALDRQLSSQAYYAAESGINDANKAVNAGYLGAKTGCKPGQGVDPNPAFAAGLANLSSNLVAPDAAHNPTVASYPCLLINPAPPNLYYNPILTTTSRTAQFTAVDSSGLPSAVTSIKISWQDAGTNQTFRSSDCTNNFTSLSGWKPPAPTSPSYIGVVRAQLIPVSASTLDRTSLANNAFTAFLCPREGSGAPGAADYGTSIGPNNAGVLVNGNCSTGASPLHCNMVINNPPSGSSTFFINLRSIYSATAVMVTAYNGATQVNLKGAQTLVDSTGKAQDVLRRVQVRIPTNDGYDIPDGTHADICKQFDLDPAVTTSRGSGCDLNAYYANP